MERFRADNDLLIQTLDAVNAGVAVINDQGNFVYVNHKYLKIYGYQFKEIIGKNYLLIIPEEEKDSTLLFLNSFIENGNETSQEWRRKRSDGAFIDVNATLKLLTGADGRRLVVITIDDVTNIKNIELQLSKSESKYRSIIEDTTIKNEEIRRLIMNAALDAIICIDRRDQITLWNPQAEKIFGWTTDEVEGRRLADIIIPVEYRERHSRGMERYLKTGHGPALNVLLELKAINRQGNEFPIELTVLPIKQEGEEEIFCAFIRDITERKKNETILKELNQQMAKNIDELAKSNVELEQYAYIASHDLQEPLRMVTNFLTQLDKKYNDRLDDLGKQYLHFAVDGAIRMRKIILDLLEYSRIGKMELLLETINLNDVIADIINVNKTVIEEKGAIIICDNLPKVNANRTAIMQVFQNLISNALKYHQNLRVPKIEISSVEHEDHWQFEVADNGIGIDSQFFEKIFVIFQRLHNKQEYSGTGIGLAICKKIVESHGGSIWLQSEIGQGTTFYFTIKK